MSGFIACVDGYLHDSRSLLCSFLLQNGMALTKWEEGQSLRTCEQLGETTMLRTSCWLSLPMRKQSLPRLRSEAMQLMEEMGVKITLAG